MGKSTISMAIFHSFLGRTASSRSIRFSSSFRSEREDLRLDEEAAEAFSGDVSRKQIEMVIPSGSDWQWLIVVINNG